MDFLDSIAEIDRTITLAINSLHTEVTDHIWILFSHRTVWIPLYIAVAALLIWKFGWKRGLLTILAAGLCILCVDQFCNFVKVSVARLRPCNDPITIDRGLWILESPSRKYLYGFFSGHAGNAIAFSLFSVLSLRKAFRRTSHSKMFSTLLLFWAAMVGISRIFVGKHYLGDVLVGFVAGAIISLAIYRITAFLSARLKLNKTC